MKKRLLLVGLTFMMVLSFYVPLLASPMPLPPIKPRPPFELNSAPIMIETQADSII